MYGLSKKEKVKFIIEKVTELELTAYEIAKKTKLSASGIDKILDGSSKNPHENTLNLILEFLEEKVVGSNLHDNVNNKTNEPEEKYQSRTTIETMVELKNCLDESLKMTQHIYKLQNLLRKNNIPFEDYFEK